MSDVKHNNVFFILVRPNFLGNIGSSARAVKNFGFRNLRFVEPPRNYKDSEARRMAVGAFDLLKGAEVFPTLSEALADVSLAVGTTSGQQRELEPLTLIEVAAEIVSTADNNRVALIFGDERNGLTRRELERCHQVVTVPTDPTFPALNMAQAVAICAYELTRSSPAVPASNPTYTKGVEDDELFSKIGALLDAVHFSRTFNRDNILSEIRQLYQRTRPTGRELDLLKGALRKINDRLDKQRDPDTRHE